VTEHGHVQPPIEAVIFDWGGTLTPWHDVDLMEQWRAYARAYLGATADPVRAAELAQALHDAEHEVWGWSRSEHRSATLADVLRLGGVSETASEHAAALAAYRATWEPHTRLDPDARGVFAALRARGLRVGVLSNTIWPRAYHEELFARDGVLGEIDGAVYTSEVPWTKPHPEVFLAAARAVGVPDAAACVFVGDRPFEDIHGAHNAGMRAVLVPHSVIPDNQRGHTEGEPDAVIDRLADLLAVIDAW
jgi:putative hydrolase of the HAD superfamily